MLSDAACSRGGELKRVCSNATAGSSRGDSSSCALCVRCRQVDAIASARILTKLFRSDNITYKIRPVANFSHIQETVAEFTEMDIKSVFMINCGAVSRMCPVLLLSYT